jgi:hypothetical protein
MLKIYNLERINTLPGGVGMPFDRAIVVDTERTEKNILTGQAQALTVYRGDLAGAHAYVQANTAEKK